MRSIPADLDLPNIIGEDLNLMGLGRYDLQCWFGDAVHLAITGGASLLENGNVIAIWSERDSWSSLDFKKLLNANVTGYKVIDETLLEIYFRENLTLQIHDISDKYEALVVRADRCSTLLYVI